jgi:hypothetical protein
MAGHVASQKAQELAQHRVVNFGACSSGCHGAARRNDEVGAPLAMTG